MKLNYESIILGNIDSIQQKCILVPYRREHVLNYHKWMMQPELLQATASDPLTLQQEYEMQQSWYHDSNKCTCIVISRQRLLQIFSEHQHTSENDTVETTRNTNGGIDNNQWLEDIISKCNQNCYCDRKSDKKCCEDFIAQTLEAMVGDVNLFLSDYIPDDISDDDVKKEITCTDSTELHCRQNEMDYGKQAEIDIMIAEPHERKCGVGYEVVVLMMIYGILHCSIRRYFCKIHETNVASIHLFEKKLSFRQCNYTECFKEYEFEFMADTPTELLEELCTVVGLNHERLSTTHLIRILPCPISSNHDTNNFAEK